MSEEHDIDIFEVDGSTVDFCGLKQVDTDRILSKSLTMLDYEMFAHFLEETDASEVEKREFAQMVWNLVFSVASLGFDIHPMQVVQNICGKEDFLAAAGQGKKRDVVK
ncbi:MAG: hypothetical protein AAF755_14270 [Pseudomonadota bacterium]